MKVEEKAKRVKMFTNRQLDSQIKKCEDLLESISALLLDGLITQYERNKLRKAQSGTILMKNSMQAIRHRYSGAVIPTKGENK